MKIFFIKKNNKDECDVGSDRYKIPADLGRYIATTPPEQLAKLSDHI